MQLVDFDSEEGSDFKSWTWGLIVQKKGPVIVFYLKYC